MPFIGVVTRNSNTFVKLTDVRVGVVELIFVRSGFAFRITEIEIQLNLPFKQLTDVLSRLTRTDLLSAGPSDTIRVFFITKTNATFCKFLPAICSISVWKLRNYDENYGIVYEKLNWKVRKNGKRSTTSKRHKEFLSVFKILIALLGPSDCWRTKDWTFYSKNRSILFRSRERRRTRWHVHEGAGGGGLREALRAGRHSHRSSFVTRDSRADYTNRPNSTP